MYKYTDTQKYMNTKVYFKYVCVNYMTQQTSVNIYYVHSKDKNILMF